MVRRRSQPEPAEAAEGLRLEEVSVEFPAEGRRPANRVLHGVSLELAPGEVLALLGPSGSGKSTLLRVIAGLEPPSEGAVHWQGRPLRGVPAHRRRFVLMFQDGQLFPHRDVAGNIGYPLEVAGVPSAERARRVAALLQTVALPGFEARNPAELSGGEQQRVALARALAAEPGLLLLDEPLSALDRQLRQRLGDELGGIIRARGLPAIMVTHDHDEAFRLADRVGVLLGGRLVQLGTPEALQRDPATAEVAAFLGLR